jgi:hypothetical protein
MLRNSSPSWRYHNLTETRRRAAPHCFGKDFEQPHLLAVGWWQNNQLTDGVD